MKTNITLINLNVQAFAQDRILGMIGEDKLSQIKGKDSSPVFRAYAITHEGEPQLKMLGVGNKQMKCLRDAVVHAYEAVKVGIKCFMGHNSDNSTSNRTEVGEVVGKLLTEIGGVLHNVVAVYIPPEHRSKKLDVASMEANIVCEQDGDVVNISRFEDITGIALADASVASPGWPGATLLGACQAFRDGKKKESGTMELKDLLAAIKAGNFSPSQLYSAAELREDSEVDKLVKAGSQKEFEHRTRVEKLLEKEQKAHSDKDAELTTLKSQDFAKEAETLRKENFSLKLQPKFKEIAANKKLGEKQIAFIGKKLETAQFDPTAKDPDKMLGDWVDTQVTEFTEYAKLMGIQLEGSNQQVPNGDSGGKGGSNNGGNQNTDFTDPKQNDFIAFGGGK